MKGVFDVALHLKKFKNVDIFNQGLFRLRATVFSIEDREDIPLKSWKRESVATPYSCFPSSEEEEKLSVCSKGPTPLHLQQSISGGLDFAFYLSHTFRIYQMKQEVNLDELVLFRLYIDVTKARPLAVYIFVELLFYEFATSAYHAASETKTNNQEVSSTPLPEDDEFKLVGERFVKLVGLHTGIHTFHPVVFDTMGYFSVLELFIHSSAINIQLPFELLAVDTPSATVTGNNDSFCSSFFPSDLSNAQFLRRACAVHRFAIHMLLHHFQLLQRTSELYFGHQQQCDDALSGIDDLFSKDTSMSQQDSPRYYSSPFSPHKFMVTEYSDVINLKSRLEVYSNNDRSPKAAIIDCIRSDITNIAGQLFHFWQKFVLLLSSASFDIANNISYILENEWSNSFALHWEQQIISSSSSLSLPSRSRSQSNKDVSLSTVSCYSEFVSINEIYNVNICNEQLEASNQDKISNELKSQTALQRVVSTPLRSLFSSVRPYLGFTEERHKHSKSISSFDTELIDCKQNKHHHHSSSSFSSLPPHSLSQTTINNNKTMKQQQEKGIHLIVLVHGYRGNQYDLRNFRNYLLIKYPSSLFLLSCANRNERSDGDISNLGSRLATEIIEFIQLRRKKIMKISFISHSLGGLIVRATIATDKFAPFLEKLHTFISFASPHCGYIQSGLSIVSAGLFLFRFVSKSVISIQQMQLIDQIDPRFTFLYQLSCSNTLSYFKNILLFSSMEDKYVPFHSALIQNCSKLSIDSKWGSIYTEMIHNIMEPLSNPENKVNLRRFQVKFSISKGLGRPEGADGMIVLDDFVGRSAHVSFLENSLLFAIISNVFQEYLL